MDKPTQIIKAVCRDCTLKSGLELKALEVYWKMIKNNLTNLKGKWFCLENYRRSYEYFSIHEIVKKIK
ncbi:hypothetical protein MM326_06225 [Alkalihalobacillus sp. LMS6]|uniref:hypothetical protein n=1 Tax=Alkalihalobacillus sp. LMS6 TaxID=2924034 RepID=UPI0020D136D8|nr:hypothetical protein [Alkalihalobacillus sp. LMS6]UTR07624.1 hypothetical protein MM326_06225 [Alkalihalobacillus sp. LMS6]